MWPKNIGATDATASFYTPLNNLDIDDLVPTVFGTQWFGTARTTQAWDVKATLGWKARYQVVNMTNVTVQYEKLVFKVIKDTPNIASTVANQSLQNPLNIAGQYLRQSEDKAAADSGDATNGGLHTERNQLTAIPAWTHWHRLVQKKKFSLAPGKMHTDYITSKQKPFNLIDWFPQTIVQAAIPIEPVPFWCRRKGQHFILYKMLSAPADCNDASAPENAESTRTTPLSLLSYQVNYNMFIPNVLQKTRFLPLATLGYKAGIAAADIVVMGDIDVQEVAERIVV